MKITDDIRIEKIRPLLPPGILMEEYPISDENATRIFNSRKTVNNCLYQKDKRLLVLAGPCSVHDEKATLEYAERLSKLSKELKNELFIVMRVYFEKPRTTVGWKGIINDPSLDERFDINTGLRVARRILLKIISMDLATGCEFLDTIMPQFYADLMSWGAIGARTTESQVHRELASGLSAPIGFKNGTNGNVQIAIDAIKTAAEKHHFLSVTKQSVAAIVATAGNKNTHLILRGGTDGPNFQEDKVAQISKELLEASVNNRVMIDCSHGNSEKKFKKQIDIALNITNQFKQSPKNIFGIMLESFLEEGNQKLDSKDSLVYGQSITDACLGWNDTEKLLYDMADILRK